MEPISKTTVRPLQTNPLVYYGSFCVYLFILLYTSVALVSVQVCSVAVLYARFPLILIQPRHSQQITQRFYEYYKTIIRFTEQSFGVCIVLLTYLLLPQTELVLSGDIEALSDSNKAILIANHQIYADCTIGSFRVLPLDFGL
jgi:hypothetical protein